LGEKPLKQNTIDNIADRHKKCQRFFRIDVLKKLGPK